MTRELIASRAFTRAERRFLKQHPDAADDLTATLELLSADAFHPRLKTHKLKGDLDGAWACSVAYDMRILFEFIEHDSREAIHLLTMGTHDEVY